MTEKKEILHILEPYYTAGKKFGWEGNSVGIGIDWRILQGDGFLKVKVGDSEKVWVIDKKKARGFCQRYKSFHDIKTVKLGVIAWWMFFLEEKNQKKLL